MTSCVPTSSPSKDSFLNRGSAYILPNNLLPLFLELISKNRRLYGPVKTSFEAIKDVHDVEIDGKRVLFGAKKIFFPKYQELFTFDKDSRIQDCLKERKIAIFGMRTCDIRAIKIMDRYFSDPEEPFYMVVRKNAFIVGMTCTETWDSCFCTQFGGISNEDLDFDIWLTPIDRGFLAESGSKEGESILESMGLEHAKEKDIKMKYEIIKEVESNIKWKVLSKSLIFESMKNGTENPLWKNIAERCFACGKCNMICPTCHCYDVMDEVSLEGDGKRVRIWDSCHLFRYGLVAGGHNFRGERLARAQYRIYDKLYYPMERYGEFACTGCGRCLDVCNADIDIREVIIEITGGKR